MKMVRGLCAAAMLILASVSVASDRDLEKEIRIKYQNGDYKGVATILEKHIEKLQAENLMTDLNWVSNLYQKYLLLGNVYDLKLHDSVRSLAIYQKALDLAHTNALLKSFPRYVWMNIAHVHEMREEIDHAVDCYRKLIDEIKEADSSVDDSEGGGILYFMNDFVRFELARVRLKMAPGKMALPINFRIKLGATVACAGMFPYVVSSLMPLVEYEIRHSDRDSESQRAQGMRNASDDFSSMLIESFGVWSALSDSLDAVSEDNVKAYVDKYPHSFFGVMFQFLLYQHYLKSGNEAKSRPAAQKIIALSEKMKIEIVIEPEKRFFSPEKTWETFRNALSRGDIESAMECHVPGDTKHRSIYSELGENRMKKMAQDMRPIEKVEMDGDSAKYRIRREENIKNKIYDITYDIYFVNVFGEWKIVQF